MATVRSVRYVEDVTLQDIAAVKLAIEICNNPELKRTILCVHGSHYFEKKVRYRRLGEEAWKNRKSHWEENVEKRVVAATETLGLKKLMQEKVIGLVLLIGIRMLTWAVYQECNLGLSREHTINLLNKSLFTQHGIIDNRRAAKELMKDKTLSIKQQYTLACLFCFTEHIPVLYRQLSREEKGLFYDAELPLLINQPEIVKFWSYYLMGEIDKVNGAMKLSEFRLESAICSGNKAALEYCLDKSNLRRNKDAVVKAAMMTVKQIRKKTPDSNAFLFGNHLYGSSINFWIPMDYYIEILYFLLSKMSEYQRLEFLENGIEDHPVLMQFLLNWPYQNYFMKIVATRNCLPARSYPYLLCEIYNFIESGRKGDLKYGEMKSYDYRKLFSDLWSIIPAQIKTSKLVEMLLGKICAVKNLTDEDRKNIELILASTKDKEKENIVCSREGEKICFMLMENENWEVLDEFVYNCISSSEQADDLKSKLSSSEEVKKCLLHFVGLYEYDAIESFIKWSSLPEEDINKLRKEIIFSEGGKEACLQLISGHKGMEDVDTFITRLFPSEEMAKEFKEQLVLCPKGISKWEDLLNCGLLELVNEFINFGLSSAEEISEFKKMLGYRCGITICTTLIEDGYFIYDCVEERDPWIQVEKFVTWCFSSEEEISEFKRKLVVENGKKIHLDLIRGGRWGAAEIFFAWLALPSEEIKELKKETIFKYDESFSVIQELVRTEDDLIDLFLRWNLIDKETVLEFKIYIRQKYDEMELSEDDFDLDNFNRVIEQRLYDIDIEQSVKKRKFEHKEICNSENKKNKNLNKFIS